MKVRLTVDRASLRHYQPAGSVIDVPSGEAQRLIESGKAVPYREEPEETAVRKAPERAVKRGRQRRRGAAR